MFSEASIILFMGGRGVCLQGGLPPGRSGGLPMGGGQTPPPEPEKQVVSILLEYLLVIINISSTLLLVNMKVIVHFCEERKISYSDSSVLDNSIDF